MFLVPRIPLHRRARLRNTTRSSRLIEPIMLRGFGATARTTLRQLRPLVDGGSLPLQHGGAAQGAASIPIPRLQPEISSLFLRLFLLVDQNRLLAKVQLSS